MVSREEEPPHTSHHGAREISIGKNKEYEKEKIFYMDVLKTIHKKIERERERERERQRRDRQKDRERERERQRQRRNRQKDRERERERKETPLETIT